MKLFRSLLLLLLLAGAAAGAWSCSMAMNGQSAAETPEPSRRQVQRRAMRASVWRFVYCLEDEKKGAALIKLLHEVANTQPFEKRIEVISCQDLSTDTLGTGPVTIFGNRLPTATSGLPFARMGDDWQFDERLNLANDDVMFLPYFRNPWSKEATVTGFYLSDNPDKLVEVFRREYAGEWDRMFWPNWAYELYQANGDRVYGNFADTSWAFDPSEEVALQSPDVPVYDLKGLKIYAYDGAVGNQELANSVSGVNSVKRLLDSLTGVTTDWYPEVRLYPTLERVGLRRGSMNPVQYDAGEQVLHLVPSFVNEEEILVSFVTWQPFLEHFAGGEFPGHNLAFLTAILQEKSVSTPQDAFSRAIDDALRVWESGLLKGTTDLDRERPSDFINESVARVRAMAVGAENPKEIISIITDFRQKEVSAKAFDTYHTEGYYPPKISDRTMPTNKLGGMTFAHEGYRVHNGYGGEKIKPSLDSLSELNVNALAIVPYTSMRDPNKPTSLSISSSAGGENDWATICSAREAQKRGWFVLLKPQIWVGGGHWPGDVDFATEEEWDTFFDNYTYWIMHYALLAEQEKIGGLCLGTELVKTTLKHPERWREVIRKVRKVYGGQLTYAANWGEEFEGFTFWDDLDAIGLNSYYPISESDAPIDEELLAGARRWMKLAAEVSQKTDRPLWLTEVGYRSVTNAWKNPHAESGDRPADAEAQARCYRAMLTAAGETPELSGMFLWKWPSYLGRRSGRHQEKEFCIGGKPAAQELGAFYGGWE
jgi:hypothetical protein